MKKILLIALVLSSFVANAQYFQHLYGQDPEIGSILKTGMNTTATGSGHLMGGLHVKNLYSGFPPPSINANLFGLHVIRTDADGRFPNPTEFNKTYQVKLSNNDIVRFTSGAVTEYSDGSGYAAMGTYFYGSFFPQSSGIAFIKLDLNGNVVTIKGYTLSPMIEGSPGLDIMAIKESVSNSGDFFATGNNWVIKIDQFGNLLWGNVYNSDGLIHKDLIESPYASELIVVGEKVGTPTKAFWMVLDPNTGAVTLADEVSSFFGTDEYLHSIDISNDPNIPGFILSGVVDEKVWVVKTDQTGFYHWAGIYEPASRPVDYIYGRDVVGRLKEGDTDASGYEYYVTGPLGENNTGDPNNGDGFVFKLDDMGNPINPNGLFIYDYGVEETGLDVDVNTSGIADGVTMYAVGEENTTPTKEIYAVKAYFNGISGCNESFDDLRYNVAEFFPVQPIPITLTPVGTEQLFLEHIEDELDIELCHNTTISGGSNARIAPDEPKGENKGTFSPNPLAQGTSYASLEVEANTPTAATVSIYDMLGRTYYTHNFDLTKGKNNLTLNISESNMAAGMYSVRIEGKAVTKTIMLMVK